MAVSPLPSPRLGTKLHPPGLSSDSVRNATNNAAIFANATGNTNLSSAVSTIKSLSSGKIPTNVPLGSAVSSISNFIKNPQTMNPASIGRAVENIKNMSGLLSNAITKPDGLSAAIQGLFSTSPIKTYRPSVGGFPLPTIIRPSYGGRIYNGKIDKISNKNENNTFTGSAGHGLTSFISNMNKTNFAMMSRFSVMLPVITGNNSVRPGEFLDMLAREVTIPSFVYNSYEDRRGGLIHKKPHSFTQENMIIQFLIDDDRLILKYLDDWMKQISPDKTTNTFGYHGHGDSSGYSKQIIVNTLSTDLKRKEEIVFNKAWPVSLGQVQLSYDSANTISVITVSFTYSDITRKFFK